MAETLAGIKRTHYCGEVSENEIGNSITVCGWVQKIRDLGNLIFIDLRDRTGIVQLAFDDASDREVFHKAFGCRSEFVLAAKGTLRRRESVNPDLPTGTVELFVEELRILNKAQTPPFEVVDDTNVKEDLRLKYRYLDLRRPQLQKNLFMRHKIAKITRDYFDENGFLEIETPMLITFHPRGSAGTFWYPAASIRAAFTPCPSLLSCTNSCLMVAGFDRYMQIARCFRDEDLRADRQPEFTQIDLEMSFVDMEDVLAIGEGYIQRVFKEALGVEVPLPLPRLTYREAMERYGSDKPDTRFGMELTDLSDLVKDCGFGVFSGAVQGGGSVRVHYREKRRERFEPQGNRQAHRLCQRHWRQGPGLGADGSRWDDVLRSPSS